MEVSLSPIQKLDIVLKFLANDFQAKPYITDFELFTALIKLYPALEKEEDDFGNEIYAILIKLCKEGFIDFDDIKDELVETPYDVYSPIIRQYRITFDGRFFINEMGGYEQRQVGKILDEERIRFENRQNRLNQKLLTWGAIGAAVGAIGLVIWEMFKYYQLGRN